MSVLVYIQNFNGKLKKQNFELASFGAKIAKQQNTITNALVLGEIDNSELEKLAQYGINKVLKASNPKLNTRINKLYTEAMAQAAQASDASIIVFPHNNAGKAIAPRLSVKLKAGLVTQTVALPTSYDPFMVTKRAFSGKAFAHVKIISEKKILTLMNNTFGIFEKPTEISIEDFNPELDFASIKTEVVDQKLTTEGISLADAEIVVSGGRGMKSGDNWSAIEELADVLGAAKACSRPVSDEGWRPHEEHVGQTGKVIAPNLYFAIGISGAIQHVAGVSGSKCIVAINNDSDAPIFQVADYGILEDANKVLPKLIEAFRAFKAE